MITLASCKRRDKLEFSIITKSSLYSKLSLTPDNRARTITKEKRQDRAKYIFDGINPIYFFWKSIVCQNEGSRS